MPTTNLLFAGFVLSAGAATASEWLLPGLWWPFALLKTLTTLLVIVHAARRGHPRTTFTLALRGEKPKVDVSPPFSPSARNFALGWGNINIINVL